MTRLSDRIRDSRAGTSNLADAIAALETELEAAYELVRALTSDRDRARNEAMEAKARAMREAEAAMGAFERGIAAAIEDRNYAIALFTLVYEMREHALRGRIANQRRELRRLNVQTISQADVAQHWSNAFRELAAVYDLPTLSATEVIEEAKTRLEDAREDAPLPAATATRAEHEDLVAILSAPPVPAPQWAKDAVRGPAATAFDGWKVGDACEVDIRTTDRDPPVWRAGVFVCSGSVDVIADLNDGTRCYVGARRIRRPERHARVVEGPLPEHPPEDDRRPIPPSEPTIDAGIASAFGAFPDLPDTSEEDEQRADMACTIHIIREMKRFERERDEAAARTERAGGTLQRVRDVLTNADRLYATAHGAHVRVLAILDEESGR